MSAIVDRHKVFFVALAFVVNTTSCSWPNKNPKVIYFPQELKGTPLPEMALIKEGDGLVFWSVDGHSLPRRGGRLNHIYVSPGRHRFAYIGEVSEGRTWTSGGNFSFRERTIYGTYIIHKYYQTPGYENTWKRVLFEVDLYCEAGQEYGRKTFPENTNCPKFKQYNTKISPLR